MIKRILTAITFFPLLLHAQDNGVRFEEGLSWGQVLAKAARENKYIFVDCYATWCAPCKKMDKLVYANDTVGNFFNDRFLSIKVQMDTSKNDSEEVKKWYARAQELGKTYKVTGLPTYLFFSPEGEIVHRGMGFQKVPDFISLGSEAINPQAQYYTKVKLWREGALPPASMKELALIAKNKFKEDELSHAIAIDYIANYLERLSEADFSTKENFEFIVEFSKILNSKGRFFKLCLQDAQRVDSIKEHNGIADRVVNYVIQIEEIRQALLAANETGKEPDWNQINKNIAAKYPQKYAVRSIINAKTNWYKSKSQWDLYAKYLVKRMEQSNWRKSDSNIGSVLNLNGAAMDIFKYSTNKKELKAALQWIDLAIALNKKPSGGLLDTKANLLYKLGKKKKAIALQEEAVKLSYKTKALHEALEKMKRGEPTW